MVCIDCCNKGGVCPTCRWVKKIWDSPHWTSPEIGLWAMTPDFKPLLLRYTNWHSKYQQSVNPLFFSKIFISNCSRLFSAFVVRSFAGQNHQQPSYEPNICLCADLIWCLWTWAGYKCTEWNWKGLSACLLCVHQCT
jgi:hypothetical protein